MSVVRHLPQRRRQADVLAAPLLETQITFQLSLQPRLPPRCPCGLAVGNPAYLPVVLVAQPQETQITQLSLWPSHGKARLPSGCPCGLAAGSLITFQLSLWPSHRKARLRSSCPCGLAAGNPDYLPVVLVA